MFKSFTIYHIESDTAALELSTTSSAHVAEARLRELSDMFPGAEFVVIAL